MGAPQRKRKKDGRRICGGARPGAGRKPSDGERFFMWLKRDTRVKADRYARTIGLTRKARSKFWNDLLESLLSKVIIPEPEYMALIPPGRLRMVSAATAE